MKKLIIKSGLLFSVLALFQSCEKFDEININPIAANVDQVQVEYLINNAIVGSQQDPHIAERAFVLYWKQAGRQDRSNTLQVGSYNDGWSSDYFRYVSEWLNHANTAVQVAEEKEAIGNIKAYSGNLKQVARIWRAYLMSEMADNFGPMPILAFQGVNPEFNSVEEVYMYMLNELKEATAAMDLSSDAVAPSHVKPMDPAYEYDFSKWAKYANSMRMRLSMRIAEVAPAVAKTHFEEAVMGGYIASLADNFQVQEKPGWDPLTGVMSREWNMQYLSPTLNNLYIGLGGVLSEDQLPESIHGQIKSANWMGQKYEDHFTTKTNDPSAGYWFDGLHHSIDPRAYKAYIIPGDFENPEMNRYPSWDLGATGVTQRNLVDSEGDVVEEIESAFTWNAPSIGDWGAKGTKNQVRSWPGAVPRLANSFRNSTAKRIFFASWESYFLIAEASVKGWTVPMSGQQAYEQGITENFQYWGVTSYLGTYLSSENYNRNGTSVSWGHVAEPPSSVVMNYEDGYTGTPGTINYTYPNNTIYMNGAVKNDLLTKIITQKFIAQTPWLPLETWNDHRRLGLPFFENPAIENPLPNNPGITEGTFMTNQVNFFPQRLKYPSSLANNVPEGYQQAVQHLGGEDSVFTPLWWAKQQ